MIDGGEGLSFQWVERRRVHREIKKHLLTADLSSRSEGRCAYDAFAGWREERADFFPRRRQVRVSSNPMAATRHSEEPAHGELFHS